MQTYIRPKASGKELLLVTRITVFVFGMFTGVLSIILFVVSNPIYANAVLKSPNVTSDAHLQHLACPVESLALLQQCEQAMPICPFHTLPLK